MSGKSLKTFAVVLVVASLYPSLGLATPNALSSLENATAPTSGSGSKNPFKGLRDQAMRRSAKTYAFQKAVQWRYKKIDKKLMSVSAKIGSAYDFSVFMLDNGRVMPPVIASGKDGWKKVSRTESVSVNRQYSILKPAEVVSVPPTWQSYLIRSYPAADKPNPILYPKNRTERGIWKKAIDKGWSEGTRFAENLYQKNLNRMTRDFLGMALFHRLAEQGLVSVPFAAQSKPRIKIQGKRLAIGRRIFRITQDSTFQKASHWKPRPAYSR